MRLVCLSFCLIHISIVLALDLASTNSATQPADSMMWTSTDHAFEQHMQTNMQYNQQFSDAMLVIYSNNLTLI